MAKKKKKSDDITVVSMHPPASEADTTKWASYRVEYDQGLNNHLDQVKAMVKVLCAKATLAELRFRAYAITNAIEEGRATLEAVNEEIVALEKLESNPV